MKIAFVCFTYKGDAELVVQMNRGIKRLRRLYPDHEITLTICDEKGKEAGDVFDDCHYRVTDFNRNGNLNGLPAINGIVDSYVEAAERTGADWVVKIDSDTYLSHLDWLIHRDTSKTSCVYSAFRHIVRPVGSCYAINAKVLKGLKALLAEADVRTRILKWSGPEDRCILALARMLGEFVRCSDSLTNLYYSSIADLLAAGCCEWLRGCVSQLDYVPVDNRHEEFINRIGVTFKDYYIPDERAHGKKVVTALEHMVKFADYADDKPVPQSVAEMYR